MNSLRIFSKQKYYSSKYVLNQTLSFWKVMQSLLKFLRHSLKSFLTVKRNSCLLIDCVFSVESDLRIIFRKGEIAKIWKQEMKREYFAL